MTHSALAGARQSSREDCCSTVRAAWWAAEVYFPMMGVAGLVSEWVPNSERKAARDTITLHKPWRAGGVPLLPYSARECTIMRFTPN